MEKGSVSEFYSNASCEHQVVLCTKMQGPCVPKGLVKLEEMTGYLLC